MHKIKYQKRTLREKNRLLFIFIYNILNIARTHTQREKNIGKNFTESVSMIFNYWHALLSNNYFEKCAMTYHFASTSTDVHPKTASPPKAAPLRRIVYKS